MLFETNMGQGENVITLLTDNQMTNENKSKFISYHVFRYPTPK